MTENDNLHDYTSKVPHFTFAETLAEQEAQLSSNPLLQRMSASRKAYEGDPYRPIYHYVNPEHMLNDPNGLCFWQGQWHMFYQAYPPEDPRQHWGHAVSSDLIHWRDLPYAIYPNPERCCFSGSTLVEDKRVIAMYHGTVVGNMVAVSSDPLLLNWEKVTGHAVIPIRGVGESPLPYRVFDPCIWYKGGMYYALSAGQLPGPGGRRMRADFLFRSPDLANWEYLHPFVEDDVFTLVGDDGACPYFWPIGDRHMLLFFSHMSGGQYLLGDYDQQRDKFAVTAHGTFNNGPAWPSGVHAPSATPHGKDVVVIFNMNSGKPTEGWNQIMTLPRRLTLVGHNEIGIEPAGDVHSLRVTHMHTTSRVLPANKDVSLNAVQGNALEIDAIIAPSSAPVIEMDVLSSPDKQEYTRIAFYRDRGYRDRSQDNGRQFSVITLNMAHASILPDVQPRAPEIAQVYVAPDEPLELQVFIDKSVVEVFVNGRQCVALRVYPGRSDSTGVSLRSVGQSSQLISLDAWEMENIYKSV
ncbi:MAG: glycoside hydrolase family 32 protein [Anaerolineae bacterium]|nr:glycoside hydrolase family 32 protein [Anaerolineae bacterium]